MSDFVFTPVDKVVTLTLTYKFLYKKSQGSARDRRQLRFCTSDSKSGLRMSDVFAEVQKLHHRPGEENGEWEKYDDSVLALEPNFHVRPGEYETWENSRADFDVSVRAMRAAMAQVNSSVYQIQSLATLMQNGGAGN